MRKVSSDKEKARSLYKMAKSILDRVAETNKEKYPSQILKDYYEVIHSLMEALSSLNGVKFEGLGAHEKLINWVYQEINLMSKEKELLNILRKHRNRITYEGFIIDSSFIKRNEKEILKIYEKLEKRLNIKT